MRIITTISILFISLSTLFSQKLPTINDEITTRFIFHIKDIVEFTDRFNYDKMSITYKYLSQVANLNNAHRSSFIAAVFNKRIAINEQLKKDFITDVTKYNKKIEFYDKGWFAVLKTVFSYKGKDQIVLLTLHVNGSKGKATKWEIVGAYAPFLEAECTDIPKAKLLTFLSPVSHVTDFVGISRALEDRENLQNYFADISEDGILAFKKGLYNNELKFKRVSKITYYFFQIPGWVFTVNFFNDDLSYNTGWLISSLWKADNLQKDKFKRNELNLHYD
jgi:hypothetical protein